MQMAVVLAAAVITAPMIRIVFMVMAAEVAPRIQGSRNKSFYDLIDISGSASDNFDADLVQSHLGTAADPAADQHFDSECVKDSGQCAMTVFAGRDHAGTKQFMVSLSLRRMILAFLCVTNRYSSFDVNRFFHH